MKKILILLLLVIFSIPANAQIVKVPRFSEIDIKVKTPYDSKQIHRMVYENEQRVERDSIELLGVLASDLIIDDVVVASKGNACVIEVEDFYKAKTFGRGGMIKISGATFLDNNNRMHRLDVEKTFIGANDIPLTRIILFNRGKQAKIKTSDIMKAKISVPFSFNTKDGENLNYQKTIKQYGKTLHTNTTGY